LAVQLELYGDPPVPRLLEQGRSVDYRDVMPEVAPATGSSAEQEQRTADSGS
jgi:hypothetical protein